MFNRKVFVSTRYTARSNARSRSEAKSYRRVRKFPARLKGDPIRDQGPVLRPCFPPPPTLP
eukprot:scaffold79794_cov42-Cyclotella_meneghiniana.AAC.1